MSGWSFEKHTDRTHESLRFHPLDVAALRGKTNSPGTAG
jgi:hypothetical protein